MSRPGALRTAPVRAVPAVGGLLPEPVLVDLARSRVTGRPTEDLDRHLARLGPRPRGDAGVLALAESADLTGHGGAHFPAARKWRAALAAPGTPVLVANAAEGEPLSAKDVALLHTRPHLVLDGLATLAELTGADRCVLYARGEASIRAASDAAAARADPVPVEVVPAAAGYVAGQGSAVVQALQGGPGLPVAAPTPTATRGLHGRPTVVHNVETLARLALLARGVPAGGPLVSVLGRDGLAVHEPAPGTVLAELVGAGAMGAAVVPGTPRAVLVGGFGGRWFGWDAVAHRRLDDLAGDGRRALGCGVLAPVGDGACGLRETASVLAYLARSSARQCGPCTFGTRDLAAAMAALARGRVRGRGRGRGGVRGLAGEIRGLAGEIDGRGACALPDGAASLARSALEVFADDVARHVAGEACAPGRPVLPVPEAGS